MSSFLKVLFIFFAWLSGANCDAPETPLKPEPEGIKYADDLSVNSQTKRTGSFDGLILEMFRGDVAKARAHKSWIKKTKASMRKYWYATILLPLSAMATFSVLSLVFREKEDHKQLKLVCAQSIKSVVMDRYVTMLGDKLGVDSHHVLYPLLLAKASHFETPPSGSLPSHLIRQYPIVRASNAAEGKEVAELIGALIGQDKLLELISKLMKRTGPFYETVMERAGKFEDRQKDEFFRKALLSHGAPANFDAVATMLSEGKKEIAQLQAQLTYGVTLMLNPDVQDKYPHCQLVSQKELANLIVTVMKNYYKSDLDLTNKDGQMKRGNLCARLP